MISNRSRYNQSRTAILENPHGSRMTVLTSPQGPWGFAFTYYSYKEADRLDLLATDLYGNGCYWWKIADANPEIMDWTYIPIGTILRLPGG